MARPESAGAAVNAELRDGHLFEDDSDPKNNTSCVFVTEHATSHQRQQDSLSTLTRLRSSSARDWRSEGGCLCAAP
jgi:hypothetical protein